MLLSARLRLSNIITLSRTEGSLVGGQFGFVPFHEGFLSEVAHWESVLGDCGQVCCPVLAWEEGHNGRRPLHSNVPARRHGNAAVHACHVELTGF